MCDSHGGQRELMCEHKLKLPFEGCERGLYDHHSFDWIIQIHHNYEFCLRRYTFCVPVECKREKVRIEDEKSPN